MTLALVESIRPGDRVVLPRGAEHVVQGVSRYDRLGLEPADVYVVAYYAHEETTHENRARDRRGAMTRQRLHLKQLKPLLAGDVWPVRRGDPAAAAELEGQLLEEEAARVDEYRNRMRRQWA